METIIKKINIDSFSREDLKEAALFIREGKLVAFPTETVYGLGGNAYDSTASARIYAAKGRPSDNPLIVHISEFSEIKPLVKEVPDVAKALSDRFWPGPLTMILEKSDSIPKETTGGLDTVAIRMPSHAIANMLIKEAGVPIAAPSANASGRPSTTKAEHVIEDLSGRIDMIIDGGSSDIGLESTIVDLTVKPALILRPGYITIEMLREVIPDIEYDRAVLKRIKDDTIVAKAPGMKYRHYAPKGELTIYEGDISRVSEAIRTSAKEKLQSGHIVGILTSDELLGSYTELCDIYLKENAESDISRNTVYDDRSAEKKGILFIKDIGSRDNEAEIASGLFDALRYFDEVKAEYIYAESFTEGGIGQAIMNRLMKAAGYHIITV
ncbi:MAG: threonylcarbamoyl-AMP synthase [Lachnospiraceae bacterium]|nr:threonylcarbamoyl-AMP synthase [Lachnospiraceae bacterium]